MQNRPFKKLIIQALIFLFTLCSCYGDSLKLEISNFFEDAVNIVFISSNEVSYFKPINIEKNKSILLELNFSKSFYLNLSVLGINNNNITDFQIVHNFKVNDSYSFVVPAGGVLTDFQCAWNKNNIIVNRIQGYNFFSWLSWLPWFPIYDGDIKITIAPQPKSDNLEDSVEFTLYALPLTETINKNRLNSNLSEDLELNKDKVKLKSWGLEEKLSLNPVVFEKNNLIVRWVDLLIHNYSAQSWILYGILQNPDCEHIKFNYPEIYSDGFTAFFPPQSQLRGPGFEFGVKKEKDELILYPKNEKKESPQDRFIFVIGKQDDISEKDLEYIPLELVTNIRLGKYIEKGVNIKGYDSYVYQAGFVPVNVAFGIRTVNPDIVENNINIPIDENGKPAFNLVGMKNIKIVPEHQSSDNSNTVSINKVGMRYLVSGKSVKTGKEHKYRVILIAPPFLAGNTPGNYSPNSEISSDSNIGNYLRYPLHLYLIPVNAEGVDIISSDISGKTELPNELIGSIEYFISDKIYTQGY